MLINSFDSFTCGSGCEVLWWLRLCFVCVCEDISGTTRAIFTIFCGCCLWPWLGPPSAGWRNPKGRGNFGVVFPTDNALYSIAYGTHTKTAGRSRCRLGWWVGLARGTVCYVGVTIPEGEGEVCGNMFPTSLIPIIIPNWTGPCSGTRQQQTFDCKRWTSLLSATKWAVRLHTRAKSDIYTSALLLLDL